MRVTFIRSDSLAVVDGYAFHDVDLSSMPNGVRALQWYDTWGEIEFDEGADGVVSPNQRIEDMDRYTGLLASLAERRRQEELPPPPPSEEDIARGERLYRNLLLDKCDYTQTVDYQASLTEEQREAWQSYRQKLRDVTNQPGFPYNVVYPISPDPNADYDRTKTHAA